MAKNTEQPIYGQWVSEYGFTAIPNFLLQQRERLGLTIGEADFFMQLLSRVKNQDFSHVASPKFGEIAERLGCAYGTLNTSKNGLVEKGFIIVLDERNKNRTNTYDLRPGITKMERLARSELFFKGGVGSGILDEVLKKLKAPAGKKVDEE